MSDYSDFSDRYADDDNEIDAEYDDRFPDEDYGDPIYEDDEDDYDDEDEDF